jgi:beta-fructofuranosidase
MLTEGKCGVAFRLDPETHDGYYLSLDLFKGVAQLRAWGSGPEGSGEDMMQFETLQASYWETETRGQAELQLLAFGSYLELCIGGKVMLSLADQTFARGSLGFCIESASVKLEQLAIDHFIPPSQSDEHLANG